MTKTVLDTNVIVSAFMNKNGIPAKVLSLFVKREIDVFYSDAIFAEYEEVLNREHFKFNKQKILRVLNRFKKLGNLFVPIESDISMIHENDRTFYDVAKQSDSFLITGNKKHYPNEPIILSPAEFLDHKYS